MTMRSPNVVLSAAKDLLFASVLLLAATACGGPRISRQAAAKVLEGAPSFKSPRVVYVPRTLAIPADGISSSTATREGEALNIIQIASVDPVVAVLRARGQVTIEDFVSAVPGSIVEPPKVEGDTTAKTDSTKSDSTKAPNDSTKAGAEGKKSPAPPDSTPPKKKQQKITFDETHTSPPPEPPLAQAWIHTLRVTPREQLRGSDLTPDDGDDNPESPRVAYTTKSIGRTPGWTLSIGAREFMKILGITAFTPGRGQPVNAGDAVVDFVWRWRATTPGAYFDRESAEFQSLPPEVQQAALTGAVVLETSTSHWARAILVRDGVHWKVVNLDWSYGDDKPHDRW